jgi:MoaA/NifB/PqqE/SkfB family radical SAM enzyme
MKQTYVIPLPKAEELAGNLGSILWLDISGGEPFLLDELPELIAPFNCEFLQVPTNGYYPQKIADMVPKILKTTRACETIVSVSLEGFREEHQRIRGNKESFDLAFESLRVLRKIADSNPHLRVKCNTVITNDNFDRLIEFMRFIQDSKLVDFHSVIMLRGDSRNPEIELPYIDKLKSKRPEIFEILDKYLWGSGIFKRILLRKYYHLLWDVSFATLEKQTQVIPCIAGKTHLVIWANGDVSSCELLPPVGNVFEQPLPEILSGERMKSQLKYIHEKRCYCTHNCVMLDSIFFNPGNYLKLLFR